MQRSNKQKQFKGSRKEKPSKRDNALILRPEFKGQPVIVLKIPGLVQILATLVTSGNVVVNNTISSALIYTFAARFVGFTEFRIIKTRAIIRHFSSQSPGTYLTWFAEDDSSTPTAAKALEAPAKYMNWSAVDKEMSLEYVPHDPAQQTWTLVSSGAPAIGYHKIYADNTNFGTSAVASNVGTLRYEHTVQFRGLI
jgi:hypothetical protein